jgi:Domain of unknown function (DU1801)
MRSDAKTVEDYLAELPADRRAAIEAVRAVVLDNLPPGYAEAMNWGMISYEVPLETSGGTYNGKPLMYAAIASQKNHMAVYVCGLNCVPGLKQRFEAAWRQRGLKPDMGAACIRFKLLDELDLSAIGEAISSVPVDEFVACARTAHTRR